MTTIRTAALAGSALAALLSLDAAHAAPPPVEAFGRMPGVEAAALSPSGDHIAMLAGTSQQRLLTISPVDGTQGVAIPTDKIEAYGLEWGGDGYVVLKTVHHETGVDPSNGHKFDYELARDVVVSKDGKVLGRFLGDLPQAQFGGGLPILQILDGSKPAAIAQGYDWSASAFSSGNDTHIKSKESALVPALWKIDVASGSGRVTEKGGTDTSDWSVDASGQGRVRVDFEPKYQRYQLLVRAKGASGYQAIIDSTDEASRPRYLGYSDPEDAIYLGKLQDDGGYQVVRRSLADGKETPVGDKVTDQSVHVLWDPYTKAPLAIASDNEATTFQWLDSKLGAVDAKLARAFKGKIIEYESWSKDRTSLLLHVSSADSPGVWYLLDTAKGSLSPVGEDYPELKGVPMGRTSWITYKAGDGLPIHAYLTLPPGAPESGGKLPLIVLPHGGPAARDTPDFDYLTQFFASRGYVVLRPQFRGSGGFGVAFERAGDREWGGKMQTDLTDGVAYLTAQGTVDPKRVCIAGWSFGGYAAMAGITLHPETYRCAVSINGVTDLPLMIGETQRNSGRDSDAMQYWRRVAGDPRTVAGMMRDASPTHQAAHAGGPVLLVAGESDTTVPYEQSTKMLQALRDNAKPADLVTIPGDDHYFMHTEARVTMLKAIDAFLAKNLPAGP
jgi:dipeptidyl aminopeptidase/acylaminoacyl peptidase